MFLGDVSDFASLGAAGVMGAMWLWERRSSVQRERQLDESHQRILRDEERLSKLTEVVEQNTAAITQFHQTQRDACDILKRLFEEFHHARVER
jgi:uncharacterized protein YigA (DUF484 family)